MDRIQNSDMTFMHKSNDTFHQYIFVVPFKLTWLNFSLSFTFTLPYMFLNSGTNEEKKLLNKDFKESFSESTAFKCDFCNRVVSPFGIMFDDLPMIKMVEVDFRLQLVT